KQANQRVNQQDLSKVQERQEMAQVIGEIANNAISIATYNEREKINKLALEKFKLEEKYGKNNPQAQQLGEQINQIQENIDRTYGIGSPNGMAIRAVTAALQAAAQNDTNGAIVALASPYLNQQIHEMTKGDTAKDKATNLIAHALLSAIEFQVTGKDPLTGAVAGVTGEATAEIIAQKLYEKSPKELTASEKENISTLSQLAGGLAGALTAKANGTSEQQGGSFLTATAGADTAKRAVENNFFDVDPHQDRLDDIKLFAKLYFNGDEEKAEAYYDAMQQGKSKGFKENVVETAEALLNLDETVKSLAYAVTHPNEVIEQVYVSMDEWNQQYEYAVKHEPALAGEMQGYILGNFGSTPVGGMVVGVAGAKLLQKSAALVKKGVEKTGVLPNWANSNSKLPIVGEVAGYSTTRVTINDKNIWSETKKFSSQENALSHWEKHKNEFPELKNSDDYLNYVHDFIKNPPEGTLIKERNNGDKLFYYPEKNTFISINKDGVPKTMFKPEAGINYWEKQK
ncbi:VENN motif pre-toxin domain-containing protein, partial [Rodentibacter pneumotropicus]